MQLRKGGGHKVFAIGSLLGTMPKPKEWSDLDQKKRNLRVVCRLEGYYQNGIPSK